MKQTGTFGWILLIIPILLAFPIASLSGAQTWRYTLVEGSKIVDDCEICGRPSIELPLRGRFDLRLIESHPLFDRYAIEKIAFEASSGGGIIKVTGNGTFEIGGEVALRQVMLLETVIDDGSNQQTAIFTNTSSAVTRLWPMLHVAADQTNGTFVQTFRLEIAAAPFRDIWFSTANGLTAGKPFNGTNPITAGDLLAWSGSVVKRNGDLVPPDEKETDWGLDAVDILPGGEIVFSTDPSQGGNHGSLRFARSGGSISVAELLQPITGGVPTLNPGLDAVQVNASFDFPQFYFSIETNIIIFQDPGPNLVLRRGDILASDLFFEGRIHKTQAELLARYRPIEVFEAGLDAFYIWPSGEVWFSTEDGFQDERLGGIFPGDLLSDQGYVVFRNLELLAAFAPLEDLADFGLDALFIVTDAASTPAAPRLAITMDVGTGDITLDGSGSGRAFQLERAFAVDGPYEPITALTPDLTYRDLGILRTNSAAFYRLRQW